MAADTDGRFVLGRTIERLNGTPYADISVWPTPDEGALAGDARTRYLGRKQGVKLYLAGGTEASIRGASGLSRKQIYRLVTERCLAIHPDDGLIYGWRGLIPGLRIRPYSRTKLVKVDAFGYGAAGAMGVIFEAHPELRGNFDKRILTSAPDKSLGPVRRSRQAHWKWFLDELRRLGYEKRKEWPFNTSSNGYSSVCRYIDKVYAENPEQAAEVIGGPDLRRKLKTGDGVERPIDSLFQRVEMDAHKLDGRFCVVVPQVTGGFVTRIIHRIWVIVILEIMSRAVLGYRFCMGREVSKDDVLRTIKSALTKWHRRTISFGTEPYIEGAGLPSGVLEDLVGACWRETSVDGALAGKCAHVRSVLKDVVGSDLIEPDTGFSVRRSKDDRPFIETFFRRLGSGGFQRMTNTTGKDPKAKGGRKPDEIAISSQFQVEYAEELLDVLIANYNATPHTSLGYRSPLAYLEFMRSRIAHPLRTADSAAVEAILSFRKRCPVKGGLKEGRRPYVNFMGARYSSDVLANRHDLVGKEVWVINHREDDARVVLCSTLNGVPLGPLRAAPPWHRLPHSLSVRQAITALARKRMFQIASNADGVEAFLEFVESQPGGKLPIHPAYLEARRILTQHTEDLGQLVLDAASKKFADADADMPSSSLRTEPAEKKRDAGHQPRLPARRMAATK